TTVDGGSNNLGTVFRLNTGGSDFGVMKSFTGPEGKHPYSGLALAGTTLYGTASEDALSGFGTLYKLNTDGGDFSVVLRFPGFPGAAPLGDLLLDGNTIYGTTQWGGTNDFEGRYNFGTVFKLNTDGSGYTALANFNGTCGANLWAGLLRIGG